MGKEVCRFGLLSVFGMALTLALLMVSPVTSVHPVVIVLGGALYAALASWSFLSRILTSRTVVQLTVVVFALSFFWSNLDIMVLLGFTLFTVFVLASSALGSAGGTFLLGYRAGRKR